MQTLLALRTVSGFYLLFFVTVGMASMVFYRTTDPGTLLYFTFSSWEVGVHTIASWLQIRSIEFTFEFRQLVSLPQTIKAALA